MEINTKELLNLKRANGDRLTKINKDYKEWVGKIYIINTSILTILLILSGSLSFYFSGWPQIIAIIIAIYSLKEIARREGHHEGYLDGYITGKNEGVNDTYGINPELEEFIEGISNDLREKEIQKNRRK